MFITDGGYDRQDNIALAKEKNVTLVTTALIGKQAPDVLADFIFSVYYIKKRSKQSKKPTIYAE